MNFKYKNKGQRHVRILLRYKLLTPVLASMALAPLIICVAENESAVKGTTKVVEATSTVCEKSTFNEARFVILNVQPAPVQHDVSERDGQKVMLN